MARRKGKPGAVYMTEAPGDVGEALQALIETLDYLDPEAVAKLRKEHGPVFLAMADAEQRGDQETWYDDASRAWQAKADALLEAVVQALQKTAPSDHYFGPRPTADGMMEWGYWERERNPEEEFEADVHQKGYRENPVLRRIGRSPDVYEYRGRRIVVYEREKDPAGHVFVQIIRKATRRGYDTDVVVAEYVSSHPFPEQEAKATIDEWYEQSKAERRAKRKRIGVRSREEIPLAERVAERTKEVSAFTRLRAARERVSAGPGLRAPSEQRKIKVTAEGPVTYIGGKSGAALFRYGNVTIELRPVGGEAPGEAIRAYPHMVSATLIGPDQNILSIFATYGGERALDMAKQEAARHAAKNPKPDPKGRKRKGRGSFMRRMMNI